MVCVKYSPNGDVFHPKLVEKSSFAWTSILATTRELEPRELLRVDGNGWTETWFEAYFQGRRIALTVLAYDASCGRYGVPTEFVLHALYDYQVSCDTLTLVRRLVYHYDTLCFHVLSVKYAPSGDVFHLKLVGKSYFAWTSILATTREGVTLGGWEGLGPRLGVRLIFKGEGEQCFLYPNCIFWVV
ncbi:hypothetical protein GOBAR_AA13866 [Gossypium barbadense]|uniref:Uncharacterized protein n=1 Tax=Gossypium barbadense TaxID=3634 RepID=A0A2P5XTT4_GOSBA|nr:hypothetical protein GOBAR_AA13866 [Gossypium barbadense]